MASEREDNVYKAKLAEQAERYDGGYFNGENCEWKMDGFSLLCCIECFSPESRIFKQGPCFIIFVAKKSSVLLWISTIECLLALL